MQACATTLQQQQQRQAAAGCAAARSAATRATQLPLCRPVHRMRDTATFSRRRQGSEEIADVAASALPGGSSAGPPARGVDWRATIPCFFFPALGGLLFGYDIGATSGVLLSLTNPDTSGTDWYELTALQSGLVVSLSLGGALLGSLIALLAGNRLGRRAELLVAALLYASSSLLMCSANQLGVLLAGRTLFGVGIGLAMHAAPSYIAETVPASVRGLLISLKEGMIVLGILGGFAVSYAVVEASGGWRVITGTEAPLALLLGLGMLALPESPRWLLLHGGPAARPQAREALRRATGDASTEAELEAELDAMQAVAPSKGAAARPQAVEEGGETAGLLEQGAGASSSGAGSGLAALFSQPRFRRPLWVGLSLMFFQQVTGQPTVLYYASKIFSDAGFQAGKEAAGVSLGLGAFKLAMTGCAVLSVDKLGRRPLLLGGVSAMGLALVVLGTAQSSGGGGGMSAWASVASLLVYVGAYQLSFGPISWLMVGEVFPMAVRGSAAAAATFVNFGSNFLVSLALPSLQEGLGPAGTYYLFAAVAAVAVASIYATVPETKGKTLEEIEAMW